MELKDMKIKTFKEFLEDKTNPVVYCLLSSNGKDFLAKESYKVELHQYNCQHDTFTIETPEDSFDAFNEYIMEHSRDLLGEPLTIKFHQYGKVVQHFSGIITRIYCKRQTGGGYGTLYISGNAPSILLDQGKACHSYENKTLKEIITLVSEGYDNSAQVDSSAGVNTTRVVPYTVQYNESDYDFICRLANLYGEYFYYDGSKLIFGNKLQETIDLGENLNLIDEDFTLEMKPQDFEYINYAIDRAEVYRKDAESACCEYKNNPIQTDAKNASKKLFKKIPQKYHSATSLEQSDIDLEEVVRQERDLRELSLKVTGRSRDPRLRMNTFACLTDINARAMETYRVIKISHYHSGMNYENSFEAIPMMRTPADYNAEAFPKAEQQPAIVKDNNDPQGMGRVRVQFFWQKGDELSPWIRMIQPYAGNGKGFYFIPEIGEEVMVDFENGNAERPFVLGAHYNGAAKSGYKPTTKAIHTQSGTKILLNDAEGSVRIEDASRNIYEMDGQGNINLYAPNNICMNAGKNFDLSVGNNMTFTVGGQATMNILQKMFLNTPLMKQIVANYEARLGNALLSSDNQMKIEAKETNVAGLEKLFIHSDELATVNSKGLLEVKGEQGTKHSNKAESLAQDPVVIEGKALVMFRPNSDWEDDSASSDNPTYGFDWYRENDTNLIGDTAQIDTLMGFYHNNDTDTPFQPESSTEVIESFKSEYRNVTIDRNGTPYRYFVPKLILYKNENEQVRSVAALDIIYDVYEEPNNLFIEYESAFFNISEQGVTVGPPPPQPPLPEVAYTPPEGYKIFKISSKSVGNHKSITVEIECLKPFGDLNGKEIKAYTLTEGTNGQPAQKKVVGVLDVMPNSKANRKVVKLLMVNVITDVNSDRKVEIGYNAQKLLEQKKYLRKYLRNSLIDPIFKKVDLDLSGIVGNTTLRDQFNRAYTRNNNLLYNRPTGHQHLSTYLKEKLKEKLKSILNERLRGKTVNLEAEYNKRYKDYLPIFFFSQRYFDDSLTTTAYYTPNKVVVTTSRIKPFVITHEVYHSLGLPHSFENKNHIPQTLQGGNREIQSNGEYSFGYERTTNIMDYSDHRNNLFYWQIKIVRSKAAPEPNNYRPEQL
jgi:phage-related baseplate assembly protein